MPPCFDILIVANEPELLGHINTAQVLQEHAVTLLRDGQDALERIRTGLNPQMALVDIASPMWDGVGLLSELKRSRPRLRSIGISDSANARRVVEAMRVGAVDCIVRPYSDAEFETVITRCLRLIELDQNFLAARGTGQGHIPVASSAAMRNICAYCQSAARLDVPILILGESGTGKEVIARFIHDLSSRAEGPFVKVNCAAMPADLLESELFGYNQGAFTGATQSKPGKFEQANHGTILLDEIGEMPTNLQAKLLHVLQDRQFSRLGGLSAIEVDTRVLAATNIDIQQALVSQRLRQDLYYRLSTFVIHMPALRERKEEVSLLLRHFLSHYAQKWSMEGFEPGEKLIRACENYEWPGNIRELENFAKRLLILRDEDSAIRELTSETVIHNLCDPNRPIAKEGISSLRAVTRSAISGAESAAIDRALRHTNWNRRRAAKLLEISYKALLYKIKQYELRDHLTASGD
jgi:two-component system response regulator AtoC